MWHPPKVYPSFFFSHKNSTSHTYIHTISPLQVRIGAKITNVPTTQAMLDAAPAVTGHRPAVVEESRVTHGNLEASVSEETGKLAFTRVSDGTVLLTEHTRTISAGTEAAGAAISFNANGASEVRYVNIFIYNCDNVVKNNLGDTV